MNGVELPIPPSVNGLWRAVTSRRAGKVRVMRSRTYSAWLQTAVLLLRIGTKPATEYPVRVTLTITIRRGKGWRSGRDLDNCYKAVSDALVHAERIADDDGDHVTEVVMKFGPDTAIACCMVKVETITREAAA